jgi:23S rRNA (pseudouridine1915-N3)-methyltransferase
VGAAAAFPAQARRRRALSAPVKLFVVAVGHRMPAWVDAAFGEYAARMPRDARVELKALKPAPRGGPVKRAIEDEGNRLLAAVPRNCFKVVLDEDGVLLDTMELARHFGRWRQTGHDVAFIVGGADGLAASVKQAAAFTWSLSPLTLPHGLARVLLAEQLYRAVSILHNHPYHRE